MDWTGENIRYLLWLSDRDVECRRTTREQCRGREERWIRVLGRWLGNNDQSRAHYLLQCEDYTSEEVALIAESNGVDPSSGDMDHERMVSRLPQGLFYMNINFLLDSLEYGGKKQLCRILSVDASTISRWRTGTVPSQDRRESLARFFGMSGEELESSAVFLSTEPIGITARKEWLKKKIDEMSSEELLDMYKALKRLVVR